MLQIDPDTEERRADYLFAVAASLLVATVLLIAGQVLGADVYGTHASMHVQFEIVARLVVSIFVGGPLLAAVIALWRVPAERARPLLAIVLIVGGATVALGIWSILDIVTVHVPGPGSETAMTVALNSGAFRERLAYLLPELGGIFVTIVAMIGANRSALATPGADDIPIQDLADEE